VMGDLEGDVSHTMKGIDIDYLDANYIVKQIIP